VQLTSQVLELSAVTKFALPSHSASSPARVKKPLLNRLNEAVPPRSLSSASYRKSYPGSLYPQCQICWGFLVLFVFLVIDGTVDNQYTKSYRYCIPFHSVPARMLQPILQPRGLPRQSSSRMSSQSFRRLAPRHLSHASWIPSAVEQSAAKHDLVHTCRRCRQLFRASDNTSTSCR
jgi:hypothetical protein